jgi:hypothetical protein
MQQAYISAFINPVFDAFGVRLLPLTLRHCYLFDALGTALPFHPAPDAITLQDAGLVCYVCSRPGLDTIRDIEAGTVFSQVKRILKGGRKTRKTGNDAHLAAVREYLAHYTERLNRVNTSNSRIPKVQYAVRIAWCLMQNMTEDQAWDMPLPRAMCYMAAANETAGDDGYLSEQDEYNAQVNERISKGELTLEQGLKVING